MKLRRGSVTVSIVPCRVRVRGKRYTYQRVRYHQHGRLQRPIFKTLDAAKAFAESKLTELTAATATATITPEDAAALARTRELLSQIQSASNPKTGNPDQIDPIAAAPKADAADLIPVELFAADYVAARKLLPPNVNLQTVCADYAQRNPQTAPQPFPKLVTEFIAFKSADGTRQQYRDELEQRLQLLAREITVPLSQLNAAALGGILDRLQKKRQWTNRSRNHYRAALSNFAAWAREKGHLPRDWQEISLVSKYQENDGPVIVWTPEETAIIFGVAATKMPELIPVLVLMFFVGHRTSETTGNRADAVPPLDWSDLNLRRGTGYLEAGKVRTAGNRITHLPPNACAWLRLHARARGPVCPFPKSTLNKKLAQLARLSELKWKRNAHRRSYISYRLATIRNLPRVSEETGTSIVTLQRRYRRPIPLTEARKYFNILPPRYLTGKLLEVPGLNAAAAGQKKAKTARAGNNGMMAKPQWKGRKHG